MVLTGSGVAKKSCPEAPVGIVPCLEEANPTRAAGFGGPISRKVPRMLEESR